MSHEISVTNGVASFADSRVRGDRVDAWHALGTPVGHTMTAQEALTAAHLADWNVRKVPLWADIRDDADYNGKGAAALSVPNKYATVFNNPVTRRITPLGVVGNKYTPIQNEALTDFANALVDESGAHYETAGSLYNYNRTFITLKLPKTMVLTGPNGDQDVTDWYLALFNSHDGSSAMFGLITQVRVVCANTANWAIRGAQNKFSVPHTAGWKANVEVARQTLGLSFEYQEAFQVEVERLLDTAFSVDDAKDFIEELVDLKKAEKSEHHLSASVKRQTEANTILKLFVESPTIQGTPIAGTAYAALNAVTEYVDHFQAVRGGTKDTAVATLLRATRSVAGTSTLKADAWKILSN